MNNKHVLINQQFIKVNIYLSLCVAVLLICFAGLMNRSEAASELPVIKVGVLQFGTINWEMDTIAHHGLDKANGFRLEVHGYASKNASAVALQSRAVDIILTDLFWVSRQRANGKAYVLMPTTKASGGVYTRAGESFNDLLQNTEQSIGVAGGSVDKNWLLLQAYAKQQKIDLQAHFTPKFGAPPLLNRFMLANELNAIINFWHYNARLKAAGYTLSLPVSSMLSALNINHDVPLLGWVFSQNWAAQQTDLVERFMAASVSAKHILLNDTAEWDRIRPLTKAENDQVFTELRQQYPNTLLSQFGAHEIASTKELFAIFADVGGHALMGQVKGFDPNIYWSQASRIWQSTY